MQPGFAKTTLASLLIFCLAAPSVDAFPWRKKKDEAPELPPVTSSPEPGWSIDGTPAYQVGFSRFAYTSSYSEVGGQLRLGEVGTYKGFNPYAAFPDADPRVSARSGPFEAYVFEGLMARSRDEKLALYGLLAETIEVASDLSFVAFKLNPAAKFSNGKSVTSSDAVFSYEAGLAHGDEKLKAALAFITSASAPTADQVRFEIAPGAPPEMPAVLGLMPILPKSYYGDVDFNKAGFKSRPVGSGPYAVADRANGKTITFKRRSNYWGWKVPTRRAHFNFETVTVSYFDDRAAMLEAFKTGAVQVWIENDPALWETEMNFYKIRSGVIYKEEYPHRTTGTGTVDRIARWVDLDRPQRAPYGGALVDTWWSAEIH